MVEIWQYILGGIFVVTILFFKGGLVGIVRDQLPELIRKLKNKEAK
jgi:urea transport system permease protein